MHALSPLISCQCIACVSPQLMEPMPILHELLITVVDRYRYKLPFFWFSKVLSAPISSELVLQLSFPLPGALHCCGRSTVTALDQVLPGGLGIAINQGSGKICQQGEYVFTSSPQAFSIITNRSGCVDSGVDMDLRPTTGLNQPWSASAQCHWRLELRTAMGIHAISLVENVLKSAGRSTGKLGLSYDCVGHRA